MHHTPDAFCRCRKCKPPLAPGQTLADYRALQRLNRALIVMVIAVVILVVTRPYW